MAWRLGTSIVRGEIDNTERGRLRGSIWVIGREEPIQLELKGDACIDMAGRRLTFINPQPEEGDHTDLHALQQGVPGDLTASRKARVLDVSVEEAARLSADGKPVPEHLACCLYLEWFSQANGRVVVEGCDFDMALSDATWVMTETEERVRADQSRLAIREWLEHLSDIQLDDGSDDDDGPMDEFEWEQFLRESDQLTDKYSEALEKYRDHPDCERLVAREMGWTWLEEALEAEARGAISENDLDDEDEDLDDLPPIEPNPMTEGVDWIRDDRGRVQHPLTARAHHVAMALWHQCDEQGLVGEGGDADVGDMVFQAQTLSAKLAGALDHLAYEHEREPGFIVACLKRALTYLHASIAAAEKVRVRNVMPQRMIEPFTRNLFELREQILHLMEEFRHKQW